MKHNLHDGFGDLQVIQVKVGTIITCSVTQDTKTVTDDNSVAILNKLYVTRKNYKALKS